MNDPAIILVAPQLAENVGTAARAMANFGLSDLRLVNPREGWPHEKGVAAASGAPVVERVRVFDTLIDAVADLGFVYATTARARDVAKTVVGPRAAAAAARARDTRTGILFGREKSGLTNEEISLADEILTLPVDPAFASLNIAQAVLIVAYEWRLAGIAAEPEALPFAGAVDPPAPRADLIAMFEHLEGALDEAAFFRPPERRPSLTLAIRAMLARASLTEQEVRTLRGMIAALERRPTRPHPAPDGELSTERSKAR